MHAASLTKVSIDFDYQSIKNKQAFTGSRYDDKVAAGEAGPRRLKYRYGNDPGSAEAGSA
jgi:hypothetical protein